MSDQSVSQNSLPDETQHSQETDIHAPRNSPRIIALNITGCSFLVHITMHDQCHGLQPIKLIMHSYTTI